MKEAAGEANMTVITIVLIGIVAAVAAPIITGIVNNTKNSANCQSAGGVWNQGKCYQSCSVDEATGNKTCTGEFTPAA